MTQRDKIKQDRLAALEGEFADLLVPCLKQSASGRYGLFGQNDHLDPNHKWWHWPEAEQLQAIADQIQALCSEFGEKNQTCERFLYFRSLRGPNVPGEPKLAEQFLKELESTENPTYNT